ncbi:MAG: FdhF/YdeP family oxidoreductase [Ilumatobacteraceae bacterium]
MVGGPEHSAGEGDFNAEVFDGEVEPQKTWAAGVPGVVKSLQHGLGKMGVRRTLSTLRILNQPDGFDCPGCAWPEPDEPHHVEFCENGVKAVAEEATTARVTREFFAAHPLVDLREREEHWLGQQGRLTEPMVLQAGGTHYEPITWDAAFQLIADELRALDSPDKAAFYTSGRTSNEAAFLYQLFARAFGTNNLPDCSNMCHEATSLALGQTIGIGKGSVHISDFDLADLIVVVGQNPGTNHPRMLSTLEGAKEHGATIVAINPLAEPGLMRFKNPQKARGLAGKGTVMADDYLQIRINGDLAFFKAVNHLLLADGDAHIDRAFVDEFTAGFAELASAARAFDWDAFTAATGFDRSVAERFAARVRSSERIIVCWAMGLTQHANSVDTIREVVNFLLLRGNIGRPGAGLCPVRGHSNVQGDRTMGIFEKPSETLLDALAAEFDFAPPRHHGFDTVETVQAMLDGRVEVFVGMGGNFASSAPDTAATHRALQTCRLTVQISTKLNASHTITGQRALILPTMGRTERNVIGGVSQSVTVEDSMSVVHASHGRLRPASEHLLSEVQIVSRLAQATLADGAAHVDWRRFERDHAAIRDSISRVIPGFANFNAKVARPGGFTLPHAPRDHRVFATATGKAHLTVTALTYASAAAGSLLLQTVRSHDQYNTTIYGLDDRYRGIYGGRRVVFVNPADLGSLGIAVGSLVDIVATDPADDVTRTAPRFRVVAYDTPVGCCAAYYPETNVLVRLGTVGEAGTPVYKSIVVRLLPSADPANPA